MTNEAARRTLRGPSDRQNDGQYKGGRAEQTPVRQAKATLVAFETAVGLAEQQAPHAIFCSAVRATQVIALAVRTVQRKHVKVFDSN